MKVLVIGGTGMLGHKLVQRLDVEFEVWSTIRGPFADVDRFGIMRNDRTIPYVDAENISLVRRAIESVKPDAVINAVGIIKQLPNSKDVINTLTINSILPHRLG